MNDIVNKDIRWGLFGLTVNEAWIHTSASEMYDERDFDVDETEEMKCEIKDVLLQLIKDFERAINNQNWDDLQDLLMDAISEYAQVFPEIIDI